MTYQLMFSRILSKYDKNFRVSQTDYSLFNCLLILMNDVSNCFARIRDQKFYNKEIKFKAIIF